MVTETTTPPRAQQIVITSTMRLLLYGIRTEVSDKITQNSTSIFLIGAASGNRKRATRLSLSIRDNLRKILTKPTFFHRKRLDVYYPEVLFDELINKFDLLELENMLANSVDAVVIIVESPGAIAELGAFSNNEIFSKKIVAVVNKRYKKDKSFIMRGPIKLLKARPPSKVIFHDLNKPSLLSLSWEIRQSVFAIRRKVTKNDAMVNPIELQIFLITLLFLFETLSKNQVDAILEISGNYDDEMAVSLSPKEILKLRTSALTILIKNGEVALGDTRYSLTSKGVSRLSNSIAISENKDKIKKSIDHIRVDILDIERKGVKVFQEMGDKSITV